MEFKEQDHPRDEDGKFTAKGESDGVSKLELAKRTLKEKGYTQKQIDALSEKDIQEKAQQLDPANNSLDKKEKIVNNLSKIGNVIKAALITPLLGVSDFTGKSRKSREKSKRSLTKTLELHLEHLKHITEAIEKYEKDGTIDETIESKGDYYLYILGLKEYWEKEIKNQRADIEEINRINNEEDK